MLRACWGAFAVSVVIVVVLSIARTQKERPPAHFPSSNVTARTVAADTRSKAEAVVPEPTRGVEPPAPSAADDDELDAPAAPFSRPPAEKPAPHAFMNNLIELACLGKLDELVARMSPGVLDLTKGLAAQIAMVKAGQGNAAELEQNLRGLSFEFENLPDGAVRVRVKGPDDSPPSPDFYLLPDGDTWRLAAESDFQEDVRNERAESRLKFLTLCQTIYRSERLGGGAVYASSAAELRERLDGVDLYSGVFDAEFAKAVDGGLPYRDYIYGRLQVGDGSIAHYATPAAYGGNTKETVIIDAAGKVWSKDLQGEPPPAAWPGPDPTAEGWKRGARR